MPKIAHIQQSFCNHIFHQEAEDLSFICSNFPQERFNVYRQTIVENMRNALEIIFPGVWKLLGTECANSVAYAYCKNIQHLPQTGCLDDFGQDFPKFLSTLSELQELPYIKDYATYEWLKHVAYGARDAKALSPLELQNVLEDEIDNVTFQFVPSCFLFASVYPLFDIHDVVQNEDANPLTLKQEPAYGVIVRNEDEVCTYWISKENWVFIKALFDQEILSTSAERAENLLPEFDLTSALVFIIETQLIEKIFCRKMEEVK